MGQSWRLALGIVATWAGPAFAAESGAPPSFLARAQPASTRRMAALLQQIYGDADAMRNPFRNAERVAGLRVQLAQTGDVYKRLELKSQLALELLQAGLPEEALKENEDIERLQRETSQPLDAKAISDLMTAKAICYLRLGEQENCLLNHNADSCLFPIQGGGVHQLPRGSRGAIGVLTELLEKYPGDLRARWLLNIAYMTLGEYPAKVPPKWLIDPKLFASDYDIKRFPDVAGNVGLDVNDLAGGVVLEDFDNDGFLDVMVSAWGFHSQLRLFRNNGDGTFTERTAEAGLTGLVSGLNLIQGDFNNDGLMDVLVLRGAWLRTEGHYPFSLLRNNGDFTFTDVTEEAGLLRFRPTQTAVWFDYNGDGWLDLFVGNESTGRDTNPCELFRNNGDGTFTECAAAQGVDFVGYFKGVASGDFNNDGRPDLLLSRRDGPPILLRNDGPAGADRSPRAPWRFTDVAESVGITDPLRSFPCWFWDYNNDGWLDVMLTGYSIQDAGDIAADYLGRPHAAQRARLYRNNGDGTFTDVSKETGVNKLLHTMGCNFGDLDNDGWLDFYVGTGDPDLTTLIPNRMFRNDGGKRFQDVTTSGGFGQLQKGHGIAFGDIDNDGDQDIYSVVGGAVEADTYHNQLFLNPGHGNNWLKLKLEGVKTNRPAIGARIKVVVQTDAGERAIHRTVGSGASFGASPMRQEIGLGDARTISRVEIFWPVTGITQVVTGLEINRLYQIREGTSAPALVELKSFTLPTAPPSTNHEHHH
jgi:FG-GAP-like repeat/ASPIC and UnbV